MTSYNPIAEELAVRFKDHEAPAIRFAVRRTLEQFTGSIDAVRRWTDGGRRMPSAENCIRTCRSLPRGVDWMATWFGVFG